SDPPRSDRRSAVNGSREPLRRPETRGGQRGSATSARRPEKEWESASSRSPMVFRGWLRRVQATAPPRARAGRAAASENGPPAATMQPSSPSAPEVSGIVLPGPSSGSEQVPEEAALAPPPAVPVAPTPLLLNRALQLHDSPVRVFGWIQNSFTGNANGL